MFYLQLASMDSPFTAAVGPSHLLTCRILNSPESTISTAVPSRSPHLHCPSHQHTTLLTISLSAHRRSQFVTELNGTELCASESRYG
jgi:hypothetical protein